MPNSYVSIKVLKFDHRRCASWLCFLVTLAGLAFGHSAIGAEQRITTTIAEQVAGLERDCGLIVDQHSSLPQRLSVIELKVFGKPRSGPVVSRVASIRQAMSAKAEQSSPAYGTNLSPIPDKLGDTMPLLNAIPPNFLRIRPPDTTSDTTDYFSDVMTGSKGKILRFKAMPVPVFVNHFPDQQFISSVIKGFETWEDRTDGAVRFVQVEDASKARIIVVWKRLGSDTDATGCTLGAHTITKYSTKGKGSVSVVDVGGVPLPIYIPKMGPKYTVPPQVIEVNLDLIMSRSPNVRYRLLQNVVTHELGHALGLLGHSSNTFDLMYTVTDEHSRLSERDINTLIKLYKQKTEVPL